MGEAAQHDFGDFGDRGVVVWTESEERETWWREALGIEPSVATGTASSVTALDDSGTGTERFEISAGRVCARRRSPARYAPGVSLVGVAWVLGDAEGWLPGLSEPWTAYSFLPARVRTARLVVTDERQAGHFCGGRARLDLLPE